MSDSSEKKRASGSLRHFRFDKDSKPNDKGQATILRFFSKVNDSSNTSTDSLQGGGETQSTESNVATKTLLSKPSTTISFRQTISKPSENGSNKQTEEPNETKVENKLDSCTKVQELAVASTSTEGDGSEDSGDSGKQTPAAAVSLALPDSKSESSTNGSVSPSGSPQKQHTTIIQKPSCTVRMSAPLFVQPLTEEEEAAHASQIGNASNVQGMINSSPNTQLNSSQNSSEGSPLIIRPKVVKRLRIGSDDDEPLEPPNKKSAPNGYSRGEDPIRDSNIDKYLSMWEKLYPMVDVMEQQDIYRNNNWEARQTMVEIGRLNDSRKNKEKSERLEKLMKMKEQQLADRERLKQQRVEQRERARKEREEMMMNTKERARLEKENRVKLEKENKRTEAKEKMKQKAASWKARGARGRHLEEYEEEEEDYNVGSAKVYDSSDSENEADYEVTPDRQIVLNFFNEGTLPELAAISSCSKKKAEVILGVRPFTDWEDIVTKFRNEKHISTDLLNEAKNVLNLRCTVKNLLKRCQNIAWDMQDTVNRIISGEEDAGITKQPELLNPEMRLKGYQLIGLNWLVLMHQQQLNGVLADEMGLGKTVQAIAFLAHLKEAGDSDQQSIIIVPSSVLDNWYRELQVWCPDLQVLLYHGSQEERRGIRTAIINDDLDMEPDVILTTYNMVTGATEDRALFKKLRFNVVILDEAHMLKNMNSQRYENLMKIKGKRRILLTGTPLQNNLLELMSILIFVMPSLFEGKKDQLKQVFSMFPKSQDGGGGGGGGGKGRFEKERIEQAKRIMTPFFLRRLKVDVLKDLPDKKNEIIICKMAEDQLKLYNETVAVLSKRAKQIGEERLKDTADISELEQLQEEANRTMLSPVKSGKSGSKSPVKSPLKEMNRERDSSGNMIMTLRKICNHPLLVRNLYTQKKITDIAKILKRTTHSDSVLQYIIEDLSVMSDFEIHQTCSLYKHVEKFMLTDEELICSGKFQKLDQLLPDLKENGARVLIFSQFVIMLNIIEKYMEYNNYRFLRLDGSTPVHERQFMIDEFNDDEEIFIFLLSTRAGGLGINLTAANTVILHDIDFNPYNDKQAEDRCHRVGQLRSVTVMKLISGGSIDEGMLSIANDKLHLEREVTGSQQDEQQQKTDMVNLLKQALTFSADDETLTKDEAVSNNKDAQEEDKIDQNEKREDEAVCNNKDEQEEDKMDQNDESRNETAVRNNKGKQEEDKKEQDYERKEGDAVKNDKQEEDEEEKNDVVK